MLTALCRLALAALACAAILPAQERVVLPASGLALEAPSGLTRSAPPLDFGAAPRATARIEWTAKDKGFFLRTDGQQQKLEDLLDQSVADARARGVATTESPWRVAGADRARRIAIPEGNVVNHLGLVVRGSEALFLGGWHPLSDATASAAFAKAFDSVQLSARSGRFVDSGADISIGSVGSALVTVRADQSYEVIPLDGRKWRLEIGPKAEESGKVDWAMRLHAELKQRTGEGPLEGTRMEALAVGGTEIPRLSSRWAKDGLPLELALEPRMQRSTFVLALDAAALAEAQNILAAIGTAAAKDPLAGGRSARFDDRRGPPVRFTLPAGWTIEAPSSTMRLANVTIPGEKPVTIAVFWFGPGGGGDKQSNIDRWKQQFKAGAVMKTEDKTLEPGVSVTFVDITGHFIAERNPGAGDNVDEPDTRMLGAIMDCPQGPIFLKATGPIGAVNEAAPVWRAWLESFRKMP